MMSEHERWMRVALDEARQALAAGEFPVGCVMVAGGRIVAQGRRRNSAEGSRNEIDHAEVVTLRQLSADQPRLDLGTVTVYSTLEPCLMCYATMLLSGIRTFVWAYEDVMGGGANLPLHMLNTLYAQMRVHLLDQVLREESLRLFQQFFRTGTYWQDSLLARYTLAQTTEVVP
ncbi:MAG: nucleoside deaminase [Desulfobulbus sp.]|uniref:nucleoside deaminase n=1 Tax=Desulfobulbus sp. TaxID=895 RepID=UPI00283B45B5|nr:nucleoside deaminase [Desulfobulbus sp.]MDR2550407.1 nucleoside deaminase [Desulfobulbus sp.]